MKMSHKYENILQSFKYQLGILSDFLINQKLNDKPIKAGIICNSDNTTPADKLPATNFGSPDENISMASIIPTLTL